MGFLRLKDTKEFTVNSFSKKYWSFYDETKTGAEAFVKSDDYIKGYSAKYTFKVNKDDLLDVSQSQLGQMLVGVFEAQTNLMGSKFLVKTNGKEGKEIRYFINYDWNGVQSTSEATKDAENANKSDIEALAGRSMEEATTTETKVEEIPF